MNQCLDLPHSTCPIPDLNFFDEVILVEANRIIKVPDPDFGEFLRFVSICMLMTENPGTNWEGVF